MENGTGRRAATMLAFASSVLLGTLPAYAEEFSGRIEQSNVHRLVRPSDQLVTAPIIEGRISRPGLVGQASAVGLRAGVSDQAFTLGVNKAASSAALSASAWGAAGNVDAPTSGPWYSEQMAQASPLQTAIDYEAIERAYSNSVGLAAGAAISDTPRGAHFGAMLHAIAARNAMAAGVMGPTGAPLGAPQGIDVDNCACGTPIPSPGCMGERSSSIYGRQYGMVPSSTPYATSVFRGRMR
jgi:hypothetical protein